MRLTPAARAAISSRSVPETFASFDDQGSLTDRGTEGNAASWKMISTPVHTLATASASFRSASRNSKSLREVRFSSFPVQRLSIPRTLSPRWRSSAAMERPMNPATPVTKNILSISFHMKLVVCVYGRKKILLVVRTIQLHISKTGYRSVHGQKLSFLHLLYCTYCHSKIPSSDKNKNPQCRRYADDWQDAIPLQHPT